MDSWCEGCEYHSYPYHAVAPILIDRKYPELLFESDDDVFDIIYKLIIEAKEANNELGKNFDIAKSVNAQIQFFACKNIILRNEFQEDICRYMYCIKMNTPAYPGCYSEQPLRWVKKSFIIKKALSSRGVTDKEEGLNG